MRTHTNAVKWKIISVNYMFLQFQTKELFIYLFVKGDRTKCEITKKLNTPPNMLSSVMKQKDKMLMFNNENMKN